MDSDPRPRDATRPAAAAVTGWVGALATLRVPGARLIAAVAALMAGLVLLALPGAFVVAVTFFADELREGSGLFAGRPRLAAWALSFFALGAATGLALAVVAVRRRASGRRASRARQRLRP